MSKGKGDEGNCNLTEAQNVTLKVLEPILVKFDNTQIAGVAMRSVTDPDWGSPLYKPDNPVFRLAPLRIDRDKESFHFFNPSKRLPQLVFLLEQLGLQYVNVDFVLNPGFECGNLLLQRLHRIDVVIDHGLNGSQIVGESRRSHQEYLLLRTRT